MHESHHYRECGLDNVYLRNGFFVEETRHGRTVRIQDMDGLHLAIGTHLVRAKRDFTGAELRFLRHELGLSQRLLGLLLGKSGQSVARWEKGLSRIDGAADRLVRLLYAQHTGGNEKIKDVLQGLAALDNRIAEDIRFEDTDEGWRLHTAAQALLPGPGWAGRHSP